MGRCVVGEWFFVWGQKGGIEEYRSNPGQGKSLCSIRNALLLGRGVFRGIWLRCGCMFVRTELCSVVCHVGVAWLS